MSWEISAKLRVDTGTDKWEQLVISSEQAKLWMETRTALLVNQPCFADVLMRMMKNSDNSLAWFTDHIPIAATDDRYMFLNPKEFFKYKLLHRVFIACHEICHAIFNHCGMMHQFRTLGYIMYPDGLKLPYNNDICQVSTDCLVNDLLIRGKVGEMPPDGHHGQAGITYKDDITTAYRKYFESMFGKGKQGAKTYSKSNGKGVTPGLRSGGFDQHLKPGQAPGSQSGGKDERNPQAWDNALAAALASAKLQGKLPADLERGLSKLLEPKIEWRDELPLTLSKRLGSDFSTWNTLDNELMLRGIGAPSKARYGCECIVFAVDTSGSINQHTMDMFMSEAVGLMEQARPRELIIVQCDAKIQEWVTIDDPSELLRPIKGGGGTDFRPVFERVAREGLEPDVLIYLTDLEGSFPSVPPSYPVIWCTITDHPVPWGDKVLIPNQQG